MQNIPVFYTSKMLAPSLSFSPSSMKPEKVMAAWLASGVPIAVHDVAPLSEEEICLAHDPKFVRGVLTGEIDNGFDNRSLAIAETLLYTNASMREAARCAIQNGQVAISPTSGFHHAFYDMATSFCTFNGLMIAAVWLLRNGMAKKVGIIDCDYHYGNGTSHLIGKLNLAPHIKHFTAGHDFTYVDQADAFFGKLNEKLQFMKDCDVILYQAGADPHVEDPLGGFLTTSQLHERDLLVFTACKANKVPVAWNLAGGYQQHADGSTNWEALTEIHTNTLNACWEVFGTQASESLASNEQIHFLSNQNSNETDDGKDIDDSEISNELREFIISIAKREDVHSVSCPFIDTALWEFLLHEQVTRAKKLGKTPRDAYFLCGPDGGIPGIAMDYPGLDEVPEEERYKGGTMEEKMQGNIHIPYEGVCGADFFIYPTWRNVYPESWNRENAQLDWATPRKNCNHLFLYGDFGESACATRIGPIDRWWFYSSTAPYKDCNPFHRKLR
jgi:acetoin utilization deacetylase AcuC-like enzyme